MLLLFNDSSFDSYQANWFSLRYFFFDIRFLPEYAEDEILYDKQSFV